MFDPLLPALRQALTLCQHIQSTTLASVEKHAADEVSPVTLADYGAQAILSRALHHHFPDDGIYAEESSREFRSLLAPTQQAKVAEVVAQVLEMPITSDDIATWLDMGQGRQARRMWTLDPIDGTKGYIGRRHWAIGLGLIEDGQPVGALMACPTYGRDIVGADGGGAVFTAWGGTAYRQPLHGGAPEKIQASTHTTPETICLVQSYDEKHGDKTRKAAVYAAAHCADSRLYELDSMEKYALIAAGIADICLHIPLKKPIFKIWDHAPGAALVHAAGGRVTDLDGNPVDFASGANISIDGLLISNGAAHELFLRAIKSALGGA